MSGCRSVAWPQSLGEVYGLQGSQVDQGNWSVNPTSASVPAGGYVLRGSSWGSAGPGSTE